MTDRAASRTPRCPPPFYPALAAALRFGALASLPLARTRRMPWTPALAAEGAELDARVAAAPDAIACAFADEARSRHDAFTAGVERYRIHPHRRAARRWPALWRRGTTALCEHYPSPRPGSPVFLVPSLINRSYILDLAPDRSLTRALAARGLRPLVVDWGEPGPEETAFSLTDYVTRRLEPALAVARDMAGGPVPVVGYCMGGLLALALAQRRPRAVSGLALLAAPWDFHAGDARWPTFLQAAEPAISAAIDAGGTLPVPALQALFAIVQPGRVAAKFRAFAALAPDDPAASGFVEVEDWLNDGVPLAGPVARECLFGWYGRNETAAGCWRIADEVVDPAGVSLPALVFVPARDRVVPPASAAALARSLPAARQLVPGSGHIGLVVGRRAEEDCVAPLADWIFAVAK